MLAFPVYHLRCALPPQALLCGGVALAHGHGAVLPQAAVAVVRVLRVAVRHAAAHGPPAPPAHHAPLLRAVCLHAIQRCNKLRIVTLGISGGRSLTGPRRPPISLYTMVPRTEGYAYDVLVWGLSIVQGPFSVAPCQTLALRFASFSSL